MTDMHQQTWSNATCSNATGPSGPCAFADAAGIRLAKTAEAIGMQVIGLNSKSSRADLEALLQTADIVSLHCSLTPKTHHLIGYILNPTHSAPYTHHQTVYRGGGGRGGMALISLGRIGGCMAACVMHRHCMCFECMPQINSVLQKCC